MEFLRKKVLRHISEHALCRAGDTLVVACSGGADSMALLDILAHLPGFKLQLVVAHLNHLLRRAESDGDEQFAREAAGRYGIPVEIDRVDVAAFAGEKGLSLEEAGRDARYAFFREVAGKYAASAVAVGHHQGDQAETVLLRLLRGAGGSGLCGMRPKSAAGMLVRPLLCVSRQEIVAYLGKGGLVWREDSSNADVRFLRNRIRHELLPYLESCSPDIAERLQQTAAALAADEDVLEAAAAGLFARAVAVTPPGAEAALDIICQKPLALRKRLYRQALRAVKGDLRRISFAHLAAIDRQVFADKPNSELMLPGGIRVIREYRLLRFTRLSDEPPLNVDGMSLAGAGSFDLPCGGMLCIEERTGPLAETAAAGTNILALPAGQLQFPLTVRYFQRGDRFTPLGMTSHKKLKDLFIDRKIPLKLRSRIPLLIDRGEIVWVCGVQAASHLMPTTSDNDLPWLRLSYAAAAERH